MPPSVLVIPKRSDIPAVHKQIRRAKLTQKTIERLPAPAAGNKLYYDTEVSGLALRVTAAGARSFVLNYTIQGRERRYTIGPFPELSLDEAREKAQQLRADIRKGLDPLEKRIADRAAPTVRELAEDYFALHADKNKRASSVRGDHYMLDSIILPKLGSVQVTAVTNRTIELLHASLRSTPYQANRVLSLLKKMFSLAIGWHWRTDNPAAGVERFQEEKRERWLDLQELERLTVALDAYANQSAANAFRLLLLTGARKGEVLNATWSQFNLSTGIWTKPAHTTKQKKVSHVPLSGPACVLLRAMFEARDITTEYLFPGRAAGSRMNDLKDHWPIICKQAGLDHAATHMHDLRHTYASHLVSSGVPLAIVGKLLGHTQAQTTERYAHLADSPLREATERFGKLMERRP